MNNGENMNYTIKINEFEGPLDLLLHLISINEVEIIDIPIFEITTQYIEYIDKMDELDMDVTSEFILMASELLEIKSIMLLPDPRFETEEYFDVKNDPRDELVSKLLEYKKYKNAAGMFDQRYENYGKILFRDQDDLTEFIAEIPNEELNNNLEENLLLNAMKNILVTLNKKDKTRENYFESVNRELFTVEDKMSFIEGMLEKEYRFSFQNLFMDKTNKNEIITTFMALLELLKINKITVVQEYVFDKIMIERRE